MCLSPKDRKEVHIMSALDIVALILIYLIIKHFDD